MRTEEEKRLHRCCFSGHRPEKLEVPEEQINKTYGGKKENTLHDQMEDFHIIADEAAAYLMGNGMAMVDESCWNDDLKTLNGHIRQIASYVAGNQCAELGPKS